MQFYARLASIVLATSLPVAAETQPVRVFIPIGIATSDVSTGDAKDAGHEYVTIDGVRVVNPSRHAAQSYEPKDFHLLVGDRAYTPSVRPGLGSLDLRLPGIVAPGGTTSVTVSFLVPAGTANAKFEFTPHWMDDSGETVDWCCYYL